MITEDDIRWCVNEHLSASDFDAWLAENNRRVAREALSSLPPSIRIANKEQCPVSDSGGEPCRKEWGHDGEHQIFGLPVFDHRFTIQDFIDERYPENG